MWPGGVEHLDDRRLGETVDVAHKVVGRRLRRHLAGAVEALEVHAAGGARELDGQRPQLVDQLALALTGRHRVAGREAVQAWL